MSKKIFASAVITIAALALLLSSLMTGPARVSAAPAALVTPVSVNHAGGASKVVTFFTTRVITQDTASACLNIQNNEKMDLQWVIDQGTTNTATLKLQFSNNGAANVVDGATFATANAADAGDMQQYTVYGVCARVNVDVTNANALTVTVIGNGK